MATKAYILIKVKAGKGKSVLTALKGIAGVNKFTPASGSRTFSCSLMWQMNGRYPTS
ncbi:MAG: hypothetical protein MRJ92_05345 [Nitrospira sp.]|nr:hypothetical protein [Nitrospira sp.]